MGIAQEYVEAFRMAHGETAKCERLPNGRFRITNRSGSHDRYTARDVRNLSRGLVLLAKVNG